MPVRRQLTFSGWEDASARHPFDRIATAEALRELPPDELVLVHGELITAVEVHQVGDDRRPTCMQLLALRDYDNRPLDWAPGGGGAGPIAMLRERYPADITHVMIWPDHTVAFDRHANAPGLTRLSSYLRDRAEERVRFVSLYDPSVIDQLDDLAGVRTVSYGLYGHEKAQAAADAGLFERFFPGAYGAGAPAIRVNLGMGRQSGRTEYLDPDVSEEMLRLAERAGDLLDSLVITGHSRTRRRPNGSPERVRLNLLTQRLQVERELPRAREGGNLPARRAVYEALRDAKRELQQDGVLQQAVEAALTIEN